MLNVHPKVSISEVVEVFKKLTSELELCRQREKHLVLKHVFGIRVYKLPLVVPLNELLSHGEVLIIHNHRFDLTLHISRTIDSLSLLLRVDVLEPTND